ncbi:hypothetical protein ACFXTH_043399 [Malus domestica]
MLVYNSLFGLLNWFLVSAHASNFVAGLSLSHDPCHQPTYVAGLIPEAGVSLHTRKLLGLPRASHPAHNTPAFMIGFTQINSWPAAMI